MELNTMAEDRDCTFMDGRAPVQLEGMIGVALAEIDEQVNVIVAALNRLPEPDRIRTADKVMGEMAGRFQWARETIGHPC